ncbi:heme o synthase [Candidatus Synchoanobacter obligatus]|uniref:Protoheme IX farnesyltransferase n=1 Tax=Candidatus Synchoanobacter obligatus TaxID=2919597 RepID=A0ABT1L4M0_9GAMM|nr:heme o synthase [Candidatus Synchoanobacter obligatus]MCP8352112.1 heme o synthase [Candidatus Synchoanobacter obligatus]
MANTLAFKQSLHNVAVLCKWRVVTLMLITAFVGMMLTPDQYWRLPNILFGLLGICFLSCAGGAINQILEHHIDKNMLRTKNRPLASKRISIEQACFISTACLIFGMLCLYLFTNPLTLALTLFATIGYGFIYTKILKPNTSQNIVIGGIFGAMPPLLGWTALTNSLHPHPILLVLIIFIWTPSHFWSLSLARIDDYRNSTIPMLPITHGVRCTQIHIMAYSLLLTLATQLPYLLTFQSTFYLIAINTTNLWFLTAMYRTYLSSDPRVCMQAFKISNVYLLIFFLTTLTDHFL